MSLFEWVLLIVAFVLFTLFIFAIGFGVGYTYHKDRQAEQENKPKVTFVNHDDAVVLSTAQLEEMKESFARTLSEDIGNFAGPQGLPGKDGKTPDAHDIIMYNGDNLFDWGEAMYERVKRVERKAGMSV